eukprot:gnl/TRDRNA2_/TRDRNA2_196646_c0_seq1.p1 gnl/TRDRNA2_/TRDRNA2_196646_c0~~gnl/TRDRNA2_/TRDRNA2_196646_c0_seq1.p1  ORF type:complete len:110 (+),score=13.86 gnl/TRDRNA2_/TRDRNA2_196646_c0_seq1:39-368(+)
MSEDQASELLVVVSLVLFVVDGFPAEGVQHKLMQGVPRTKMVRGAFAFGSSVIATARQGLNFVHGDQVRCFIQQRWLAVPQTKYHGLPAHGPYLHCVTHAHCIVLYVLH